MSPWPYYAVWLVLGLAVAAVISVAIFRALREREQAGLLVDALTRYAMWLATQRTHQDLDLQRDLADSALRDASLSQGRCFPELAPAMERLRALDRSFEQLRARQQHLREQDLEAWLESDHDRQLDGIAQDEEALLQSLLERLAPPRIAPQKA